MNIKQKKLHTYRVHTPIKSCQVTPDGKNQRFKLRSATKPENRLREKVEELHIWLLSVASYFCTLAILICCKNEQCRSF